jgi:hypothetical protein
MHTNEDNMSFSFSNIPGQNVYNPLTTSPDVIDDDNSGKNMASGYSRVDGATHKLTNIFSHNLTTKVTSRSKEKRNTL